MPTSVRRLVVRTLARDPWMLVTSLLSGKPGHWVLRSESRVLLSCDACDLSSCRADGGGVGGLYPRLQGNGGSWHEFD